MTGAQIDTIVDMYEAYYDTTLDKNRLKRWATALANQPFEEIAQAMSQWIESDETYPPKPADLMKLAAKHRERYDGPQETNEHGRTRDQVRAGSRKRMQELDVELAEVPVRDWFTNLQRTS